MVITYVSSYGLEGHNGLLLFKWCAIDYMVQLNKYPTTALLFFLSYSGFTQASTTGFCTMSGGDTAITNRKEIPTGTVGIGEVFGTMHSSFSFSCTKPNGSTTDSFYLSAYITLLNMVGDSNIADTNIDGLQIEFDPSSIQPDKMYRLGTYSSNGQAVQTGSALMSGRIVKTKAITNVPSMNPILTLKNTGIDGASVTFSSRPSSNVATDNTYVNPNYFQAPVTLVEAGCHITFSTGAGKVDFGQLMRGETKTVTLTAKLEGCAGNYAGASWKLIPQAMTGNSWTSDVLTSSGVNIPTVSYYFRQSGSGTNLNFNTAYAVPKASGDSATSTLSLEITAQISPTSNTGTFTNMMVLEAEYY